MFKLLKYAGFFIGILLLVGVGTLAYQLHSPAIQWAVPPNPGTSAEQLARGQYLVENVAHCGHCHSPLDTTRFGMPAVDGQRYTGTYLMGHAQGLPGEMYTANLTPVQIGAYSDEELYRVITQGVAKDGHAIFPMMPYKAYGTMDPADVWAMVAYLRSLPANGAPMDRVSTLDFPVNFFVKLGQAESEPKPTLLSSLKTPEAIGAYYVNVAGCNDCHSPENDKHEPDYAHNLMAGGRVFILPDGSTLRTPNLTPHATGLGSWTEEQFVRRFKAYGDSGYVAPSVKTGEFNTYMAWHHFKNMQTDHLKAIYAYLRTVPAKDNIVKRWEPKPAQASM